MPRPGAVPPLPVDLTQLLAGYRWQRAAGGDSRAKVFRLTADDTIGLFVKYATGAQADEVIGEAARLRWLRGRVPVARLVHLSLAEEAVWLVTEALPGEDAVALLRRRPGLQPVVIHQLALLMRRFHAIPVRQCPYDAGYRRQLDHARRNVDAGWVDDTAFHADYGGLSARGLLMEAERLIPDEPECVVTHGDFSLPNVLFDDSGLATGCVDVGRVAVADSYQDIAVMWRSLQALSWEAAEDFMAALGIVHADPLRIAFHRCLYELR